MNVRAAIGAVLELAALHVADGLADVEGHRAGLRVRHLPARAEDPSELADDTHHVRCGDGDVEVVESLLDLRGEVCRADDVSTGLFGLFGLLALCEHGDAHGLAGAVRKHQRPAELLVGVADVETEAEVRLHCLVEGRALEALQELERLDGRVLSLAVDLVA